MNFVLIKLHYCKDCCDTLICLVPNFNINIIHSRMWSLVCEMGIDVTHIKQSKFMPHKKLKVLRRKTLVPKLSEFNPKNVNRLRHFYIFHALYCHQRSNSVTKFYCYLVILESEIVTVHIWTHFHQTSTSWASAQTRIFMQANRKTILLRPRYSFVCVLVRVYKTQWTRFSSFVSSHCISEVLFLWVTAKLISSFWAIFLLSFPQL